jgi:hypothetical protein
MSETNHKPLIVRLLELKKEEILNYDMDEPWAEETLNAIDWQLAMYEGEKE